MTENQKSLIQANYADMSNKELAQLSGATVMEIKNYAKWNKLKKSPERMKAAQKEVSGARQSKYEFSHLSGTDRKAYMREAMRVWRAENKERAREIKQRSDDKNREALRLRDRIFKQEQRKQVIAYYSNNTNKCACCGYNLYAGLTIDHINGGGRKHTSTKGVGMGSSLINWLVQNNYPTGFQILCANCNRIKGTQPKCNCGVKFS